MKAYFPVVVFCLFFFQCSNDNRYDSTSKLNRIEIESAIQNIINAKLEDRYNEIAFLPPRSGSRLVLIKYEKTIIGINDIGEKNINISFIGNNKIHKIDSYRQIQIFPTNQDTIKFLNEINMLYGDMLKYGLKFYSNDSVICSMLTSFYDSTYTQLWHKDIEYRNNVNFLDTNRNFLYELIKFKNLDGYHSKAYWETFHRTIENKRAKRLQGEWYYYREANK